MKEAILGILVSWAQAYATEPFYTGLIGIAVGMVAVVVLSAWFHASMHLRDRISGGPILIVSALAVFAVCLLWTAIDGMLVWLDKPLLSEYLILWVIPEPELVPTPGSVPGVGDIDVPSVEVPSVDMSQVVREILGSSKGPSAPLLPGGVSMAIGLLFAGLLYYLIARLIGSTLSEMLSLTRKPEDIIREERRKRAEEKEKARAEAEAAQSGGQDPDADGADADSDGASASAPDGQKSTSSLGAVASAAMGAGAGGALGAVAKAARDAAGAHIDANLADDEDEDYDPETMGAPLPNDFWGNLYKLGGHFRSYQYVENRFVRWQRVLSYTFFGLVALGAIPATGGYMPVPMWVGGAIFATAFFMLVSEKSARPEPVDTKAEGKPAGAGTSSAPTATTAFAERAEVSVHLRKAPTPPAPARAHKARRVHAARVLDDITSALGMDGLYPHQAEAMAAFDSRRSVLLCTAPRSGRQVLCDALALYAVLADGERVLYLAESAERASFAHQRFAARAEATHWKWNILAVDLADRAGTLDPSQSQPALVFADARAVHRQLCGQNQRWQTFLAGLGTVVVPALDTASGPRAGHLGHVLRRLERRVRRARTVALGRDLMDRRAGRDAGDSRAPGDGDDRAVRFVVTAHPGHDNLARYAERIIGAAVTVIGPQHDGAPRPRQDARIIASSFDAGGAHPALGMRDLARELGYRPALHGYDELFTDEQREPAVPADQADVLIVRHNPGNHGALALDTTHLGDLRPRRGGHKPSVAILWQPDPTPMARLWADELADAMAARESRDSRKATERDPIGRALIAWPGAPAIERSHLLCTLGEGEVEIDELTRVFSRRCLREVLGELRRDGQLLQSSRRLLDVHAGEVRTVHSVRLSSSEDIHAEVGLATCDRPWLLCERATGDVLAQLEGARARAAAYPLRVFTARGRRFEVLADELQDQLGRRRILCQQIDADAVSAPIRTLFIEVVERRRERPEVTPEATPEATMDTTPEATIDPTEATIDPTDNGDGQNPDQGDADNAEASKADADAAGTAPGAPARRPERRRGALRSLGGARFSLQHRNVAVTETMSGVRRFDLRGNELDTSFYERQIESSLRTQATIFGLPPEHLPGQLVASMDALHALAHGFAAALPSVIAYRPEEDLDIAPLARTGSWSTPSVVFVDLHPGGAGFAEAIDLGVIRQLCRHTLALMRSCVAACETGCPECIHLWTCRAPGQHHQRTDKASAMVILEALLGEYSGQGLDLDDPI